MASNRAPGSNAQEQTSSVTTVRRRSEGLPEHISLNLIALFSANGLIFTPRRLFIGRNLKDITAQMVVHT